MKLYTSQLSTGGSFIIIAAKQVLQWSVIAASTDAEFTLKGNGVINSTNGSNITFITGAGGYNSVQALPSAPWDGITITCTAGLVNIAATTD